MTRLPRARDGVAWGRDRRRAPRRGRWAVRLAPAVLVALLPACAKAPEKRTEVVFWQPWPAEVIQPLLARFEAENPGLAVRPERLDPDSAAVRVLEAVAADSVPDLCELGSSCLPRFLDSGALADWSAGVAGLRDSVRGWEMCSVGETVYGLPWVLEPRALFYAKSLFARARLDPDRPPQTWDELRRAAAAIQRLGQGVHGFGLVAADRRELFEDFMPFAWGNGGEVLSARLDSSRFDSPENRAALAFYLGLRQSGALARRETLERAFEQGRLGLLISGAGLIDRLGSAAPDLRYGVALVPAPGRDRGVHASLAEGEVLVSFTASRRKEAALRLARFLARPANALQVARSASRFLPATAGVETLASASPGPERTTLMRQLANARFKPDHPEWDAMETAIEDAIGKALADHASPAESAAARATAEADRAIAALVRKR